MHNTFFKVNLHIKRFVRFSPFKACVINHKTIFKQMLKIPTFIIGGLLIITGLVGYLFQDLGLSIKIKGPLADNAEFTLSDGKQEHILDLGNYPSKKPEEFAFGLFTG